MSEREKEGAGKRPTEWELLAMLREELPAGGRGVALGIGDDCSVLRPVNGSLVVSTDACLENVHYRRAWLSPEDIAHKALNAAVSDIAAMGAELLGVLCHITVPPDVDGKLFRRLARGQAAALAEIRSVCVGGNLSTGAGLDLVTTAFGSLREGDRALTRAGAKVGDEVWLCGAAGQAHLGLLLLEAGRPARTLFEKDAVLAFRRPRARMKEGRALLGRAHAGLDVSDGLVGDATHLAEASRVSIVLEEGFLLDLVSDGFSKLAKKLGVAALDALLFGGEDYGLLATGPKQRRPPFAKVIGRVARGSGVWLEREGERLPLTGGFTHGVAPPKGERVAKKPAVPGAR